MSIIIISAQPGLSTTERILELVQKYPEGITIRQMQHQLNRPVSMLNICLKPLLAEGKVNVKLSKNGMQRVYYPA